MKYNFFFSKTMAEGIETEITNKATKENELSKESDMKRRTAIILFVTVIIFGLILIINCGVMIYMTYNPAATLDKESESDENLDIVTPEEWTAYPSKGDLTNLVLPVEKVIIAHTATANCTTRIACVHRVKFIQIFHMEEKGWDEIGYNFLVGGDGAIYIGRGWNKQGAHTGGNNQGSVCIAFIGNYASYAPTRLQSKAAQFLIEEGVIKNKISPNYKLYGHRQLMATESPGDMLYNVIKTWPHWYAKQVIG